MFETQDISRQMNPLSSLPPGGIEKGYNGDKDIAQQEATEEVGRGCVKTAKILPIKNLPFRMLKKFRYVEKLNEKILVGNLIRYGFFFQDPVVFAKTEKNSDARLERTCR